MNVTFRVNGDERTLDVEPRLLLVQALREGLGLTGTHVGCDTSSCGACTVLLDGVSVKSCTMFAVQAEGRAVTTIEGIGTREDLHPMQEAFREHHGLQCGFCTPGQIMSAIGLIDEAQAGDDPERIREGMSGNLCRCGAYAGITEAVLDAQQTLATASQRRSA